MSQKKIKWIRPSGTEVESKDNHATIKQCIKLGWKRAKGSTEDEIKKEMDAAASSAATFDPNDPNAQASSTATFEPNKNDNWKDGTIEITQEEIGALLAKD